MSAFPSSIEFTRADIDQLTAGMPARVTANGMVFLVRLENGQTAASNNKDTAKAVNTDNIAEEMNKHIAIMREVANAATAIRN